MAEHIENLTTEHFDAAINEGNVVVDFWAVWCGPCKIMEPHFEAAASDLKETVLFAKVNVDENYELAERFGIMAVPTTLFFKDGELVEQAAGVLTKEQILKKVKDVF